MQYEEFEAKVKAAGLTPRDCGNGHWRIENGKYEVNWWPFSRRKTIYVNGLSKGNAQRYGDCEAAIAAALSDPDIKRRGKRGSRKKHYRREKRAMLKRDPRCHWCKCSLTLETATLDHVIPLARGGSNATDNMVLSCEPCNKEKGNELWKAGRREQAGFDEAGLGSSERPLLRSAEGGTPNRDSDEQRRNPRGDGTDGRAESNRIADADVLGQQEYRESIPSPTGEQEVDSRLRSEV